MALHPGYVMLATSASPDATVNLAGAIVWWQACTLAVAGPTFWGLAVLWAASIGALLTRRIGATLVIGAAAATMIAVAVHPPVVTRTQLRRALLVFATVAMLAVFATVVAGAEIVRAVEWVQFDPIRSLVTIAENSSQLPAFLAHVFKSFWLYFGWRYIGPPLWNGVAAALTMAALLGIVLAPRRVSHPATLIAICLIGLQLAAVIAFHFGIQQHGAQGRYLYPVVPPVLYLLWLGWRNCFNPEHESVAAVSLVAVMALLNAAAWIFAIFPTYL
jgi:hypothetical protein